MIGRVITVLLFVQNVQESKEWYRRFLSLEPAEDQENFASFKIGESFLNFHPADSKSPLSAGGCVAYWETQDLDEIVRRAEKLGAKIYRGPLKVQETGRTICQIQDPFGNVIGLEAPTVLP